MTGQMMETMWRILGTTLVVALVGAGVSACDDSGDDGSGGLGQVTKVEIAVSDETLSFSAAQVGSSTSQVFLIQNVSDEGGVLVINSIKLEASSEFAITCSKGVSSFRMNPGEIAECQVTLTPTGREQLTGSVVIDSNAVNASSKRVTLTTLGLNQDIEADPAKLVFSAREGQESRKLVTVRNVGTFPLEIYGFEVTGQADVFSAEIGPEYGTPSEGAPLVLNPHDDNINEGDPGFENNELRIFATYAPETTGSDTASLLVYSNDPDTSVLTVELTASSNAPCILVLDGTRVDFGASRIGDLNERTITIQNCGNDTLEIGQIEPGDNVALVTDTASDSPFVIDVGVNREADNDGLLTSPVSIEPGATDTFIVGYAPIAEVPNTGSVYIHSNDDANPLVELDLFGRGVINQCPTAVAKGTIAGINLPPSTSIDAAPLQTLIMDGTDSTDLDGSVVTYNWEVVQRPDGSVAQIAPVANEVADPARRQLFLDLAGRFIIRLTVLDDGGSESCESADISVIVIPNEAIHIQQVWNNPSDPDQTDFSGSDVDLHFLKMGSGNWFGSPYDNYFGNREPLWNPELPSLDIDDTSGAGPENINLDNPVACQWYAVGVHYWRQQFGTAYTTIRIYINGLLVFEALNKPLTATNDWWDVARIHWPSGQVILVDTLDPATRPTGTAPVTQEMIDSGLCGVDELLRE